MSRTRISVVTGLLACAAACGDTDLARGGTQPVASTALTASAASVEPRVADTLDMPDAEPTGTSDAGVDAARPAVAVHGAEPGVALLAELTGKVILHAGDSMVGGQAGLTRGLELKFKAAGVKSYKSDSWVSANLSMFHQQPRFAQLLQKHEPDLVLITLGANDSFTSAADTLAPHVRAIVAKIGARPCLWISPPPFVKAGFPNAAANFDKFVDMLAANVAPCRFFDTRVLDASGDAGAHAIPRSHDNIHPTDKGGLMWADAVWNAAFP